MVTYQRTIRTESAAISTARQSLDNVLSAKANLEQQTSSPDISADKHYALEFQLAELEGMLTEITDERFARTVDESQPDNENRNVGLLNFIIDTADNILASLSPTSNTPPPTYQRSHIAQRKPKVESRDSSFPLPHDQRNSKRKSTHAAAPSVRSTPTKPTNNSRLVASSKPLPSPFQSSKGGNTDSSIDDLSLSAFQALKTSDAFKTLLDRAEQTNEIDRNNLPLKEAFGNNVSKELLCAFDVLIRISSFERSSKDTTHSRRVSSEEPTPRFKDKGKAPLRSGVPPNTSETPSSSPVSSDSDFVTIKSPDNTQSPPHNNNNNNNDANSTTTTTTAATSSSQPPPYSQHILPTTPKTQHASSLSPCVNCGSNTPLGRSHHDTGLENPTCGHVYCPTCAVQLIKPYIYNGRCFHPLFCRCNERIRKVDLEKFISSCTWNGDE